MEEHKVEKVFQCDMCSKDFFLQWRMKNHRSLHLDNTKICKCLTLPFEELGCNLEHELASKPYLGNVDVENKYVKS